MKPLLPAILATALLLSACAGDGPVQSKLPDDPAAKALGIWKDLGDIRDGNIRAAYDTGSIKRSGDTVRLRDRKIVLKPEKESDHNTPRFQTAIGEWELDCKKRTFRLLEIHLWDENKKLVSHRKYTAAQAPARPVVPNSPALKQLELACGSK